MVQKKGSLSVCECVHFLAATGGSNTYTTRLLTSDLVCSLVLYYYFLQYLNTVPFTSRSLQVSSLVLFYFHENQVTHKRDTTHRVVTQFWMRSWQFGRRLWRQAPAFVMLPAVVGGGVGAAALASSFETGTKIHAQESGQQRSLHDHHDTSERKFHQPPQTKVCTKKNSVSICCVYSWCANDRKSVLIFCSKDTI